MYDPMTRHAVQVLKKAGCSIAKIIEETGVSRRSAQRLARETSVEELVLDVAPGARSVGRPRVTAMFAEKVEKILAEEPDLPTVEVLHRLRGQGYAGGKSALYELAAGLRPAIKTPTIRFEGVPGEFSQHDFGSVRIAYLAGASETIHFFASRLKYSRWSRVILVRDERVESLVRALLSSFEDFGGVPLVGVFDNPKTIVISRNEAGIEWNSTFGQVVIDARFAAELCTPHFANQKGAVENLVKWVKNSFFKVRRFHDREDLERQLAEWHDEVNTRRPSRATGVPPAARIGEERRRLRPLPFAAKDYPLRFPVTVNPTAMVEHDGIRYSMPPKAIGMPGTLFLYPDRVRIVARHLEAEHPRVPERGFTSYVPEHRADLLAAVSGDRGRLYLKRQQLFELGPAAVELLTEVIHARPRTWKGDVESLYEALQAHGPGRLLQAIEEAYAHRLFGAEYVTDLLRKRA